MADPDDRAGGGAEAGLGEDEVALLGDGEPVDTVDVVDEQWAPGEPPPGLPAEEVLTVHEFTAVEPDADELDVSPDTFELPGGELPGGELPGGELPGGEDLLGPEELDRPGE